MKTTPEANENSTGEYRKRKKQRRIRWRGEENHWPNHKTKSNHKEKKILGIELSIKANTSEKSNKELPLPENLVTFSSPKCHQNTLPL